ncbi:hypothetical protein ACGFZS_21535 [Streptomyces sp. NPDC048288]|uniref:hypothetical protein n=1 Tax=Streptomyces sp. NPDC048288 TaxID=3365529 RepID=UPI0037239C61
MWNLESFPVPMQQIHTDAFDLQIWLIESWTGAPVDVALDEQDAIAWFQENELGELRLAHDSCPAMFSYRKWESRRRGGGVNSCGWLAGFGGGRSVISLVQHCAAVCPRRLGQQRPPTSEKVK